MNQRNDETDAEHLQNGDKSHQPEDHICLPPCHIGKS